MCALFPYTIPSDTYNFFPPLNSVLGMIIGKCFKCFFFFAWTVQLLFFFVMAVLKSMASTYQIVWNLSWFGSCLIFQWCGSSHNGCTFWRWYVLWYRYRVKKEGSVVSHAPTVAFLDLRILERPGPFFCYTLQTFHHSARKFTKSSTPFMLKVVLCMFNSWHCPFSNHFLYVECWIAMQTYFTYW